MTNPPSSSVPPPIPKTIRELAHASKLLLKDAEYTFNSWMRSRLHASWPNVPVAKIIFCGKIASVACTGAIAFYKYKQWNQDKKS
jgi:hypothetical protein